jgi:hypothetical protein
VEGKTNSDFLGNSEIKNGVDRSTAAMDTWRKVRLNFLSFMLNSKPLLLILILLLECCLVSCSRLYTPVFLWEEDVKLQDGSILQIKRSVSKEPLINS